MAAQSVGLNLGFVEPSLQRIAGCKTTVLAELLVMAGPGIFPLHMKPETHQVRLSSPFREPLSSLLADPELQ